MQVINAEADGNEITIGTLDPGQSESIRVRLNAEDAGQLQGEAVATAYCAQDQTQPVQLAIAGIPALQLEMIDEADTFEAGSTFDYEVRVLNEGTAKDLNIQLMGQLPEGMTFVEGQGPDGAANVSNEGRKVKFTKLPELEPGDDAVWHLTVRAEKPGKFQRFEVRLRSDAMQKPIREVETTTIY